MAIARALIRPPKSRTDEDRAAIARNAALAGLRVVVPHTPPPEIEVWPEHWAPMQVAAAMRTQMAVGMAGATGWRYEALPVVFRMLGVPLLAQREMFDDLQTLEDGMVGALREPKSD